MSFHASRQKVYAVIFSILAIVAIILFTSQWFKQSKGKGDDLREHFTEQDMSIAQQEQNYSARLTVIDVFDAFLKRNPTPSEINKYSVFKNEQDILMAVMKDYPSSFNTSTPKTQKPRVVTDENFKARKVMAEEKFEDEEHFFDTVAEESPYIPHATSTKCKEKTLNIKREDIIALKTQLDNAYNILNKML